MIRIGGVQKSSLLDYPNKISAVIFTYGCNLRCPYCHNPELVVDRYCRKTSITQKELFDFLKKRIGKLDGVVITGGEPLMNEDMDKFIIKIRKMGFLVKLDTNGFYPERLKKLIDKNLLDYIAMDVKYPKSKYIEMTGGKDSIKKISKSIKYIMESGLDCEFRTTYVKNFHNLESALEIGKMIEGAKNYYIQNFREGKTINPLLNNTYSFSQKELLGFKRVIKKYVKNVYIR